MPSKYAASQRAYYLLHRERLIETSRARYHLRRYGRSTPPPSTSKRLPKPPPPPTPLVEPKRTVVAFD